MKLATQAAPSASSARRLSGDLDVGADASPLDTRLSCAGVSGRLLPVFLMSVIGFRSYR